MRKRQTRLLLTERERDRVESILVSIKQSGDLLLIDVSYWVKASPKFAIDALAVLRFMNGDDCVPKEDEVLFSKGFVLIKNSFNIFWYSNFSEWIRKIILIEEKNPEAIDEIIKEIKKIKSQLALWVVERIEKRNGR